MGIEEGVCRGKAFHFSEIEGVVVVDNFAEGREGEGKEAVKRVVGFLKGDIVGECFAGDVAKRIDGAGDGDVLDMIGCFKEVTFEGIFEGMMDRSF